MRIMDGKGEKLNLKQMHPVCLTKTCTYTFNEYLSLWCGQFSSSWRFKYLFLLDFPSSWHLRHTISVVQLKCVSLCLHVDFPIDKINFKNDKEDRCERWRRQQQYYNSQTSLHTELARCIAMRWVQLQRFNRIRTAAATTSCRY